MLYTFSCSQPVEEQRESIEGTRQRSAPSQVPDVLAWGCSPCALGNQLPHQACHECQPGSARAVSAGLQARACPVRQYQNPAPTGPKELGQPSLPPHTGTATGGEPGHPATLTRGSRGAGHPSSPIQASQSVAVAHLSPSQDTTHLGYEGNPGVLAPRPCSTTQLCQYHSRIISKPLCQPGEPASCEAHRNPKPVLTSPNIHWLLWEYWPSSRQGGRQAGRLQLTET